MPLPDNVALAAAAEMDELRAKYSLLYDALAHVRNVAKQSLLPDADRDEGLRKVTDIALAAKRKCDGLFVAAHVTGMEIVDEEVIALATAAGGFHHLTPDGKIQYIGAMKRASMREAKSLREHGTALLALNHEATKIGLALLPDEQDDA